MSFSKKNISPIHLPDLNEALTQPAVISSMSVMERVEKHVKSV